MHYYFLPLILTILSLALSTPVHSASSTVSTEPGYSLLRKLLVDEQYLTAIRRVKYILNFGGISARSADLVDQISSTSEEALHQLDFMAAEPPAIQFDQLDESDITISTFDALRYDMARKFIFDGKHFEKDLLLSQVQVLPVITHLTKQLETKEINTQRKKWLQELAGHYADFYQRSQNSFVLSLAKK